MVQGDCSLLLLRQAIHFIAWRRSSATKACELSQIWRNFGRTLHLVFLLISWIFISSATGATSHFFRYSNDRLYRGSRPTDISVWLRAVYTDCHHGVLEPGSGADTAAADLHSDIMHAAPCPSWYHRRTSMTLGVYVLISDHSYPSPFTQIRIRCLLVSFIMKYLQLPVGPGYTLTGITDACVILPISIQSSQTVRYCYIFRYSEYSE